LNFRWLGDRRGYLSDWATQRWVQLTGRRVRLAEHPWLEGPTAPTSGVGRDYFDGVARDEALDVVRTGKTRGILKRFAKLSGPSFDPSSVDPAVVDFYECTSDFEMDAWAEWCGAYRPFGGLLARIFSRRLQQLNVPLSPLETSRGVTSEVIDLVDPKTREVRHTAWLRLLVATGNVLYAGTYSVCSMPSEDNPCVKVVFPLPNGNAMVIMRPEVGSDGSFLISSHGRGFGAAGFYFTVRKDAEEVWVRYVRSMRETIRVFRGEPPVIRADHVLTLWGPAFLRLHYRMRKRPA
jgi:hypothetical protein